MNTIEQALGKLKNSKFRAKFHLSEKDKAYVREKGVELLRSHCADIVRKRLAPAVIANDGKQTPMRGHPVFVAQHACACCCRSCLNKWYNVKIGVELSDAQQMKIINLLMAWIKSEMEKQDQYSDIKLK